LTQLVEFLLEKKRDSEASREEEEESRGKAMINSSPT
jgi:hypothetical protein